MILSFSFLRFRCKNAYRSGRPITEKVDEIVAKVEQDRCVNSYNTTKELNIHRQTALSHLRKARYSDSVQIEAK